MYLVTESELQRLQLGELSIKDLIVPEKQALITWSGEDVKIMIKQKRCKVSLQDAVDTIKHVMEHCECAQCFQCAVVELKNELKKGGE